MTTHDALAEARTRWGELARVEDRPDEPIRYRVGTTSAVVEFYVIGWGTTWERAFRDADRRKELHDGS